MELDVMCCLLGNIFWETSQKYFYNRVIPKTNDIIKCKCISRALGAHSLYLQKFNTSKYFLYQPLLSHIDIKYRGIRVIISRYIKTVFQEIPTLQLLWQPTTFLFLHCVSKPHDVLANDLLAAQVPSTKVTDPSQWTVFSVLFSIVEGSNKVLQFLEKMARLYFDHLWSPFLPTPDSLSLEATNLFFVPMSLAFLFSGSTNKWDDTIFVFLCWTYST